MGDIGPTTLGKLLTTMRLTSCSPNKVDASRLAHITAEHLRNIEADRSRPSPEVLSHLLDIYDAPHLNSNAWVLLAEALLPGAVRREVRILPKETT